MVLHLQYRIAESRSGFLRNLRKLLNATTALRSHEKRFALANLLHGLGLSYGSGTGVLPTAGHKSGEVWRIL